MEQAGLEPERETVLDLILYGTGTLLAQLFKPWGWWIDKYNNKVYPID